MAGGSTRILVGTSVRELASEKRGRKDKRFISELAVKGQEPSVEGGVPKA